MSPPPWTQLRLDVDATSTASAQTRGCAAAAAPSTAAADGSGSAEGERVGAQSGGQLQLEHIVAGRTVVQGVERRGSGDLYHLAVAGIVGRGHRHGAFAAEHQVHLSRVEVVVQPGVCPAPGVLALDVPGATEGERVARRVGGCLLYTSPSPRD